MLPDPNKRSVIAHMGHDLSKPPFGLAIAHAIAARFLGVASASSISLTIWLMSINSSVRPAAID
jgi:hypothetical protein